VRSSRAPAPAGSATTAAAVPTPAGAQTRIASLPRHVAIVMDGNGRWAKGRGLSRQAGHRAGSENIRTVVQRFAEHGVAYLTLYAFSTENWTRPKREVDGLLRILGRGISREIDHMHQHDIRVRHLGRLDTLPARLQRQVVEAIALTKDNTGMTVCVAFNYGSRAEIADALRRIVADGIAAAAVDEELVASYLYTAGMPDPDLIIRTGGELRLSNFLLWQAAYAEFYATPTYWPDFGRDEIDAALTAFAARERRFGGVADEDPTPRRGTRP